jgi:hypothetical protein
MVCLLQEPEEYMVVGTSATAGSAQAQAWDLFLDAQSESDKDNDYRESWDSQRAKHRWEVNEMHFCYPSGCTTEDKSRFKAHAQELGFRGVSYPD